MIQVLAEDRTRNRLEESLGLFDGIINLSWFKEVPVILFLNKDDLFRDKIEKIDIAIYFPNYNGGCEYEVRAHFLYVCVCGGCVCVCPVWVCV